MKICLSCSARFSGARWRCPQCGRSPQVVDGFPAFAPALAEANDGFEAASHALLDRLQAGNFWFRERNALIADLTRRYFPGAREVLEIGCGTGFVLQALREALPSSKIVGADVYSNSLPYATRRTGGNVELLQMDVGAVPYSEQFDLICAFDVLEHVVDDNEALRQMRRALKADGGVLLAVPQHPMLWSAADDHGHHKRRYRRDELAGKCRAAGFDVIFSTSFVTTLLPFMYIRRRLDRNVENFDPVAEVSLPKWLDVPFGALLHVERAAIGAGWSLPFGGSCFVVARNSGADARN
jgi:SAM-dependent methyltransferase